MSAFIPVRVKDKSVLVFVPILECIMQIFHVFLLNVSLNSYILIYPGSGLDTGKFLKAALHILKDSHCCYSIFYVIPVSFNHARVGIKHLTIMK